MTAPSASAVAARDTAAIVADLHDLASRLLHDDGLILSRVELLIEAADRLEQQDGLLLECEPLIFDLLDDTPGLFTEHSFNV